jgi:molecular chaperone DnaJ
MVELMVETPTKLTARQKELVRELAGICGEQQHPRTRGFFTKAKHFWDGVTGTDTKTA